MITDADVQNLQIDKEISRGFGFSFLDLLAAEIPGNAQTEAVRKPHPRLGGREGGGRSSKWNELLPTGVFKG